MIRMMNSTDDPARTAGPADTSNGLCNRDNRAFWICFGVYLILGLVYVFLGVFWADESWYFGGSWLVAGGEVPYRDFFAHHNPLFYYVYALPQYFFGPSLLTGRLTSLVIMMLAFVLVWRLARKLGGNRAALIAGGLLITNIFLVHYYTTYSYHILEAFFMVLFFCILFSGWRDAVKYPLTVLMLCLVIGIRYPVDIVSAMLVLYLIYIIYRFRHRQRVILLSLGVAVLSLAVILLPFILMARDQYFFGTVTYNFNQVNFWAEFMGGEIPDLINRIYHALLDLSDAFLYFYAAAAILLGLLVYVIIKTRQEKRGFKELISRNQNLVLLIVFILLFEVFCAAAYMSAATIRSLTFPAAAILAGAGVSRVLADLRDKSATWFISGLLTVLIVLTPFALYSHGGESRPALKWSDADLKYLQDVSSKIAGYTREGDSVLTFTPPLALLADRKLVPGTVMETFNFFPTWETPQAQKYHLLNQSLLLDCLAGRQAGAVVLDDRFHSGQGQGRILNDYRQEILRVLDENYYLVETVSSPPQQNRANVYIYLPRSP
jgi:4-amino-4-deoxy-L-arabinose transferase-like glycosyltransferase